jgi:ornithine carbamoyltransferase
MKKDLVALEDFSAREINGFLDLAAMLKKERKAGKRRTGLQGKTVVLLFDKPSLRTRVTFEVGILELGGDPIYVNKDQINLGQRETIADGGRNLERWVHGIIFRTFAHSRVKELAANTSVPVINALTDDYHPCQALATIQTLREHKKNWKQCKVVFVGDGNNVAASLLEICAILGLPSALVHPAKYDLKPETKRRIMALAKASGTECLSTTGAAAGLRDADMVYTDVWTSMGQEKEGAKRRREFAGYQVDSAMLKLAKPDAIVSHCLPAHRGDEISAEVLDGPRSVVFDEAENRLHVQKAVMLALMGRKPLEKSLIRLLSC